MADELRPLTVGEILNEAIRIYISRFATLFGLASMFILPVVVIYAFSAGTTSSGKSDASLFTGLLLVLTSQLASGACLKAVSDIYLGHPTGWRASFDFLRPRVGWVVAVAILDAVMVGVGLVILVLPGLYLDIAFIVATPALLFEGLGPVAALRRSRALVSGFWWRTFGCYLLAAIFVGLVSLFPTLVLLHSSTARAGTTSLAGQLLSIALSLFTTPFTAAVVVLLYYDLRVRKEGFGLQDLALGVNVDPDTRQDRWSDPPLPDR